MRGGFYRFFYIYLALITAGVGCGFSGCTTTRSAMPLAEEDRALLTVVNQTDYTWTVALRRGGDATLTSTLNPRESSVLHVEEGSYEIEQVVVGSARDAYLVQIVACEFKAGHRYRWPLVTLLSDPVSPLP